LHGLGDIGEDAVVFAVDEAEGDFEGGELAGDLGEAFDAEAGACLDEAFRAAGASNGAVYGVSTSRLRRSL
jgi:hypothetical protein